MEKVRNLELSASARPRMRAVIGLATARRDRVHPCVRRRGRRGGPANAARRACGSGSAGAAVDSARGGRPPGGWCPVCEGVQGPLSIKYYIYIGLLMIQTSLILEFMGLVMLTFGGGNTFGYH